MRKAAAIPAIVTLSIVALASGTQAWTMKTLYKFKCCEFPAGHLIRDRASGDLYGTTGGGGVYNAGTIFKLSQDGEETVLYNFSGGADGGTPRSGPIKDDAGNLFGTASDGRAQNGGGLLRLAPDGTYTVLYSFPQYWNVIAHPHLNRDTGDFYGTAFSGSLAGHGLVFRLAADGTCTVLHTFGGGGGGGARAAAGGG